ncbi:MAG: mycofactocin-coupled SDR family oxidoreductase [Actinobacteria bacterium]|nr:mycofactocin-coupled SDR family oxidoreductase [Actinomycetota bacterium]
MGRMDGKVALITGAARGQGRSHALRLAEEGAEIIAVDICDHIDSVPFSMGTGDDLAETAKMVENLDRRIVTSVADVRDSAQLAGAVELGLSEFGHIDVVCANAGIASMGLAWELTDEQWQDVIDVNLTGVWRTLKAVIPTLIEQGTGGSIIITSSMAGEMGLAGIAHYTATKHATRIRVNCVCPTTVNTPMIQNDAFYQYTGGSTAEEMGAVFQSLHTLPVPWVEPIDISNAVLFLASDESRYVTGLSLWVDAGFGTKVGAG